MAKTLIIGGNSGIGLATAALFKTHNHDVMSVSRQNKFDYTDESIVRDFFKKHTNFNQIIITATTPLVIGSFKEIELQKARLNFEKYWGMVNVIHYATRHSKYLEAITLISGAAAGKRGGPITYLAVNCAAVNTLAESLAVELAPIRINVVSPGVTDTSLYGKDRGNLSDWVQADPLKRVATSEEVAQVIYFVSKHPHMTGAIVACDGGGGHLRE
jgi:NAD(P)-dependent dehydrogenase (short-subunit alcohol dehydrogenase family)